LEIEGALFAAMVAVSLKTSILWQTRVAAIPVLALAVFGAFIALHHRTVEAEKIADIHNCEKHLGLIGPDLIDAPLPPSRADIIKDGLPWNKGKTGLLVVCLHVGLFLLALFYAAFQR
jgi:hypothetical protein